MFCVCNVIHIHVWFDLPSASHSCSYSGQHGGCGWLDANLAPGHLQLACWPTSVESHEFKSGVILRNDSSYIIADSISIYFVIPMQTCWKCDSKPLYHYTMHSSKLLSCSQHYIVLTFFTIYSNKKWIKCYLGLDQTNHFQLILSWKLTLLMPWDSARSWRSFFN